MKKVTKENEGRERERERGRKLPITVLFCHYSVQRSIIKCQSGKVSKNKIIFQYFGNGWVDLVIYRRYFIKVFSTTLSQSYD